MRQPLLRLFAAALLLTAAPAFAHDGDGGAAVDDGAINCPIAHAAPAAPRHVRRVRHAHRSGGCPTEVARAERRRMVWRGEGSGWAPPARPPEEEYGRQNFSWAPTGPGDERPGPSIWRPGQAGPGLYGMAPPPAYAWPSLAPGYAERGFDHRGVDQRDGAEREFGQRFGQAGRGYGEGEGGYGQRAYGDRYAQGGPGFSQGDHRFEQRGLGEREYAFGYSHEEQRSWSSQGGAFIERRSCNCGPVSATDQYGFLTWPGKTHFWRGPPPSDQPMGPGGPPWADPQGPVEVHP